MSYDYLFFNILELQILAETFRLEAFLVKDDETGTVDSFGAPSTFSTSRLFELSSLRFSLAVKEEQRTLWFLKHHLVLPQKL